MKNPLTYAFICLTVFLTGLSFSEAKEPYRIAVIDSGFSPVPFDSSAMKLCKAGHYDFSTRTASVGYDTMYHGSYVTALINQRAAGKKICFLIYKVFGGKSGVGDLNTALQMAHTNGARAVNLSLSFNMYSEEIKKTLQRMTRRGVKVFAAAGNSKTNMNEKCSRYPACYQGLNSNFVRVGALDDDVDVAKYSNYGLKVSVYKYGRLRNGSRGTSFAAPRALGDYVRNLKPSLR